MVDFLLYAANLEASVATRSKMSGRVSTRTIYQEYDALPLTNEFKIDMARLEIPVSGWTCLRTVFSQQMKQRRPMFNNGDV
jgi:hypothetical protein